MDCSPSGTPHHPPALNLSSSLLHTISPLSLLSISSTFNFINSISDSVMSDCEPVDVAARLLCPWDSRGRDAGVGCHSLLQGIFPTQRSNPGLPHCRQILLPTEPPWKPKKTGVGSLSLLQRIFLTQESNQGLLHCKRILYQLSYWGRMGHRSKGKMQNNPEKLQKSSHEQTCTVQ